MADEDISTTLKVTQEQFDERMNRIQLAFAKQEAIVKSWTDKSSRQEPRKTDAELDAEDALLFRNAPPYLGVGAAIPAEYLVSDAERNNKALRAKLLPGKGLKGSKPRNEEEKFASAKRALNEESSDEEGGRSTLGKAKKLKTMKFTPAPPIEDDVPSKADESEEEVEKKLGLTKLTKEVSLDKNGTALVTPPVTPEKTTSANRSMYEVLTDSTDEQGRVADSIEVQEQEEEQGQKEEEQEESSPTQLKHRSPRKQKKLQRKKGKLKSKRKALKDQGMGKKAFEEI